MSDLTVTGDKIAARAAALIGAPFRLHGRDPATGLDCIGLAAAALVLPPGAVPTGYSHRGSSIARWTAWFAAHGFTAVDADDGAVGDIVLTIPGPGQTHLLIAAPGGHIHAHAGLGRVVLQPGLLAWPVAWRWRAGRHYKVQLRGP